MNRQTWYSVIIPAAGIIYVIIGFIVGWGGGYALVGALVLGLIAVLGRLLPLAAGTGRARNRDR